MNKGDNVSEFIFKKIAAKVKEHTGVAMHLIDASSKEFRELYKEWKQSPVQAVFHEKKFVNSRYGIELDGPAIYFFQGGAINVKAYTIQHELFHVKLWYKLVKEFGQKGGQKIYDKIPIWLHEADVIGEMLKANKIKPGKWPVEEILEDLNILNDKLKNKPHWNSSCTKITGKAFFELKEFENWDITKWFNFKN